MPTSVPQITYASIFHFLTLTPDSRTASWLLPRQSMYRPALVWLSRMKHSTAKTRKMIRPTGILPILIRLLYQPPSAELWGQLTVWVLVNTEARPLAMFMLAMDTINGGTEQ